MIIFEQKLIAETRDSTASILKHGDKFLGFIIEDGYRTKKEYGKTRILGAVYDLIPMYDHKNVQLLKFARENWGHEFILLFNLVVNFKAIYYHWGNTVEDTLGCPLVNSSLAFDPVKNVYFGAGSRDMYKKLYNHTAPMVKANEQLKVKITR